MTKKYTVEIIEGEPVEGQIDESKLEKTTPAFPAPEPQVEAYRHHHGGPGGPGFPPPPPHWPGPGGPGPGPIIVRCPRCGGVSEVRHPGIWNCCFCGFPIRV